LTGQSETGRIETENHREITVSEQKTIYTVPEKLNAEELKHWMQTKESLVLEGEETIQRVYFDSFDWRLFRSGTALEIAQGKKGRLLNWRRLDSGEMLASTPIRKIPRMADDLVAPGLRSRLKKILGERALMPQVNVNSETRTLSLRNDTDKTLLRIELRNDHVLVPNSTRHYRLAPYICLFPYRGYEKVFDRVSRDLTAKGRLDQMGEDPLVSAAACLGVKPCDYNNKPAIELTGDETSISALKSILTSLKEIMDKNIEGSCKDQDPEFLHDFLLGVRRTHCLLNHYGEIFPQNDLPHVRRDFAWIEEITREVRNLDIHLGLFDDFKSRVDEEHKPALEPLYHFIREQKKKAHKTMRVPLESHRYAILMKEWETFLGRKAEDQTLPADAMRPIRDLAGSVIWRLYTEVSEAGGSIVINSTDEELIALQKLSKKLGYQMEIFQSMYARPALSTLRASHRDLQKILDDFHDLHLQSEALRKYQQRMQQEQRTMPTWLEAIDLLVQDLEKQERKTRDKLPACFKRFSNNKSEKAYAKLFLGKKTGKKRKK
jgi:CHAD domain-containing protein